MTTFARKPVRRETLAKDRGRAVIVEIEENGLYLSFRLKGLRTRYRLPTLKAFWEAVKVLSAQLKEEKKQRRLERRKANSGNVHRNFRTE